MRECVEQIDRSDFVRLMTENLILWHFCRRDTRHFCCLCCFCVCSSCENWDIIRMIREEELDWEKKYFVKCCLNNPKHVNSNAVKKLAQGIISFWKAKGLFATSSMSWLCERLPMLVLQLVLLSSILKLTGSVGNNQHTLRYDGDVNIGKKCKKTTFIFYCFWVA